MLYEASNIEALYVRRATICTALTVAEEAAIRGEKSASIEADKLTEELKIIDLRLSRLEAGNDVTQ